jgi:Uma2 family endonuclease
MPISVEEYVAMPPLGDDSSDELIQGEIVLSPSAKPLHAKIVRRLLKLLEPLEDAGYELATDFGCILGEHSNRKGLMARKAALYLEYGAQSVWIVYPARRTLIVHDASGESEFRAGELVEFSGVAIPIDRIFPNL